MKGPTIRTTVRASLTALLCLAAAAGAHAQEPTGWTLNPDRSELTARTAVAGPATLPTGLVLASTGIAARGLERTLVLSGDELSLDSEVRFKARLDGRDYPIHGLPVGDTIAIDTGDGDAVTSVIKAGGEKVATFRRSLSEDQRTMIVTARYYGDGGRVAREKMVFERR
jgi:hypothetical protein